jgi:hypothetical protein
MDFDKAQLKTSSNLLFSLHLYADWRRDAVSGVTRYDKNKLKEIVDKGIPLMIGEFADEHPESKERGCKKITIGAEDIIK